MQQPPVQPINLHPASNGGTTSCDQRPGCELLPFGFPARSSERVECIAVPRLPESATQRGSTYQCGMWLVDSPESAQAHEAAGDNDHAKADRDTALEPEPGID